MYSQTKSGAYCYYDFSDDNAEKYGKLYNWYAVNDARGLAPEGWHVPSEHEWRLLMKEVGGEDEAFAKLRSASGWLIEQDSIEVSGFNAKPEGGIGKGGSFVGIGEMAIFWSSTSYPVNDAFIVILNIVLQVLIHSGSGIQRLLH